MRSRIIPAAMRTVGECTAEAKWCEPRLLRFRQELDEVARPDGVGSVG